MTGKFHNRFYLVALILLSIVSHWRWFDYGSILTSGDWQYRTSLMTSELYKSWGAWTNIFNLGSPNISLYNFPIRGILWPFIVNMGLSYDIATKLTLLIPIAVMGFVLPYIIFSKIFKNYHLAFLISLFYGSTTYFLTIQQAHLFIAFIYALLPVVFYFFVLSTKGNKINNWILFAVVFSIGSYYEIRMMYIIFFLLLFYFLMFYEKPLRSYYKNIAISIVTIITLNAFWLIPAMFSGKAISDITGRGLFGENLFKISYSLANFLSSWTGGKLSENFTPNPINWYFWGYPIIAFSSIFFVRLWNREMKKLWIYFLVVSFFGILLSKQSDVPFTGYYLWMYENFPGFSLFRDASKFYLLIAFGYAGLISFTILGLLKLKKILLIVLMGCFIVSTGYFNLKPVLTGEIGGLMVNRSIPEGYVQFNQHIESEEVFFRTLWVPIASKWATSTMMNPRVSLMDLLGSDDTIINNQSTGKDPVETFFGLENASNILNRSSIRFVVVPLQDLENDDNFFKYFSERDYYTKIIDNLNYLEKIDSQQFVNLAVYENKHYSANVYAVDEIFNLSDLNNLNIFAKYIRNSGREVDYIDSNAPFANRLYIDTEKTYFSNLIENYSFEDESWTSEVGNCFNYDNNPIIRMSLNSDHSTLGNKSLQLEAVRHVACTSTKIKLKHNIYYLLTLDYQNPHGSSGYSVFMSDKNIIKNNKMPISNEWEKYNRIFKSDMDIEGEIFLYCYPKNEKKDNLCRYDNVKMLEIGSDVFNVISEVSSKKSLKIPRAIETKIVNSSKKLIKVNGASAPFVLGVSDMYNKNWNLSVHGEKNHIIESHFIFNSTLNGWYVDITTLCISKDVCVENEDGTYNIELIAEYFPQRLFFLGGVISLAFFMVILFYIQRKRKVNDE